MPPTPPFASPAAGLSRLTPTLGYLDQLRAHLGAVLFNHGDTSSIARNVTLIHHAGRNFNVFVLGKELPYAAGDKAQQALADRVFPSACRSPDTAGLVVDVGGLYGDYGITAATHGCHVAIIEPQPPYAGLIQASVHFSGLANRVVVVPVAAGPVDGADLYFVAGNHNGNNAFFPTKPDNGTASVVVRGVRLDTLFGHLPRILYLKIDVEGFDVGVVKSADALLRAGRIVHMHFEYSPWWTSVGQGQWREVFDYLHGLPHPPRMYALHRDRPACFGPITPDQYDSFHSDHLNRHWQSDIYATFDDAFDPGCEGGWALGIPGV